MSDAAAAQNVAPSPLQQSPAAASPVEVRQKKSSTKKDKGKNASVTPSKMKQPSPMRESRPPTPTTQTKTKLSGESKTRKKLKSSETLSKPPTKSPDGTKGPPKVVKRSQETAKTQLPTPSQEVKVSQEWKNPSQELKAPPPGSLETHRQDENGNAQPNETGKKTAAAPEADGGAEASKPNGGAGGGSADLPAPARVLPSPRPAVSPSRPQAQQNSNEKFQKEPGQDQPEDSKTARDLPTPDAEGRKKATLLKLSRLKLEMNDISEKRKLRRKNSKAKEQRKQALIKRKKMEPGEKLRSEMFKWKVIRLLGSGGFGDVYKVVKDKDPDTQAYAMKTEMVQGDKRMLRLKIEVMVLAECLDAKKAHFVDFVDRGKNRLFKFLVMGLVGPSLDDIRRKFLANGKFTKPSALQASIQTLESMRDLHNLGYLHRDIKPQNFAVGIGDKESVIYMLDFGIARKFTVGTTKEVKLPRSKVKFIGTIRFASRACHECIDQGRKDDLETWLYMAFDLFDTENGISWKSCTDKMEVLQKKKEFFEKSGNVKDVFKLIPQQMARLINYIDQLQYAEEPDYEFMLNFLKVLGRIKGISVTKKLDWVGKLDKKKKENSDSTESDLKQSGSDDEL